MQYIEEFTKIWEGTGGYFEQATVSQNANWDEKASTIIENAGIEDKYRDRFNCDIQLLTLPRKLTIYTGTTENLYYDARTSKDEICDLSDCEITVTSSDESVVTATKNTVTAKSVGKAWITYTVCRKNSSGEVTYFDKYSF